ncbi:MAG: (2Fe-2S) ferredoxin domain-containing protein [Rhodocyclaceae bacterium]|jgi:(2Fe-2S) ferredoxin|nr:(2Fe-2S) ferredoxin domain-containing protein [Rhodocyclaceae bacterium]
MSYFKQHVFICCNQRDNGDPCCNAHGATTIFDYAKGRVAELNLNQPGMVRINKAGCLGRCLEGPVMVIYPEAVWYQFVDKDDVNEIIESHLVNGIPVDRLRI